MRDERKEEKERSKEKELTSWMYLFSHVLAYFITNPLPLHISPSLLRLLAI
jgi:hypothetical protein